MLFIFRKLRRSFFLPGKVRTYVAYAVGEIILIVVGILIAVQIGDWKETARLEKQRVELIENLKRDFKTNVERLSVSKSRIGSAIENHVHFLETLTGDISNIPVPELKSLAGRVVGGAQFQPALGAYEAAISTGSIGLVNNPYLNDLIINFKDDNMSFQAIRELRRFNAFTGSFWELRKKIGSLDQLYDSSFIAPKSHTLTDSEFREFLNERDVYATFDNHLSILSRLQARLESMLTLSEEILTTLDAL